MSNTIAKALMDASITNIIVTVDKAPSAHVCQEKSLKFGRKLGALVNSNAKQATFTPMYDNRKNMDVSFAILFIAPMKKTD